MKLNERFPEEEILLFDEKINFIIEQSNKQQSKDFADICKALIENKYYKALKILHNLFPTWSEYVFFRFINYLRQTQYFIIYTLTPGDMISIVGSPPNMDSAVLEIFNSLPQTYKQSIYDAKYSRYSCKEAPSHRLTVKFLAVLGNGSLFVDTNHVVYPTKFITRISKSTPDKSYVYERGKKIAIEKKTDYTF